MTMLEQQHNSPTQIHATVQQTYPVELPHPEDTHADDTYHNLQDHIYSLKS